MVGEGVACLVPAPALSLCCAMAYLPPLPSAWSSVELSDSQLLWPKGSSAPGHRGVYPERTFSIPQQMGTASLAALRRPCHPLQMGPAVDVITAC